MTLIDSIYNWLAANGPATVATIAVALDEERPVVTRTICHNPHRFAIAGHNGVNVWRVQRCVHSIPYSPERNRDIYRDHLLGKSLLELSRTYGLTKNSIWQILKNRRAAAPAWKCQSVILASGRVVQAHYSTVNHVWLLADGVTVVWPVGVGE